MGLRHIITNHNHKGPLGTGADSRLSVAEVEVVTCLIEADHSLALHRRLLEALSHLCSRHGWARATVELELMSYGNDGASSHLPLEAGMASAAILEQLSGRLAFASWRQARRLLRPSKSCPVCEEMRGHVMLGALAPYCQERTRAVNDFTFTRWWLDQTERVWRPLVCAMCLDPQAGARGSERLCRRHLGEQVSRAAFDAHETVAYLEGLREQLLDQTRIYLVCRALPDPDAAAALSFAALGWLYGWDLPVAMAGASLRRRKLSSSRGRVSPSASPRQQ
jgi:hypothetical protein